MSFLWELFWVGSVQAKRTVGRKEKIERGKRRGREGERGRGLWFAFQSLESGRALSFSLGTRAGRERANEEGERERGAEIVREAG